MIHPKLEKIHLQQVNRPLNFEIGDTVKVHYKIKEGNKERIQIYEGVVIAISGRGAGKTFTVRRISHDVGVERIFPLYAPTIDKIEKVRSGRVRRAKLYYLREKVGKHARLKEVKREAPKDKIYEKAQKLKEEMENAKKAAEQAEQQVSENLAENEGASSAEQNTDQPAG
ncbi:MAG: 50S ribosomal protein L19 [Candidatus Hydrogenedentota bacterium]|nr:MAG: 50S ribosomal protein L19 [Candidatus Hydrogenedentota bacterium]